MRALTWCGKYNVKVQDVEMPRIVNPRDAIIKVTSTAICGSDLHLYDGYIPSMKKGDVLGHEFMGEVVDVGPGVDGSKLRYNQDDVSLPDLIVCRPELSGQILDFVRRHGTD